MFEHFRTVFAQKVGRALDVTPEEILRWLPERSFPGVVWAVFQSVAVQLEKSRVGNKLPGYWTILPQLNQWFSNARFLHVLRDGRDVALSTMAKIWGEKTVYGCARKWVLVQQACRQFSSVVSRERFFTLRYEQLLTNPREIATSLETFLRVRLSPGCRQEFVGEIECSEKRSNFEKWRTRMSSSDLRVYEAVAGDWLRHLGYETVYNDPRVSWFERSCYQANEIRQKARFTMQSLGSRFPLD